MLGYIDAKSQLIHVYNGSHYEYTFYFIKVLISILEAARMLHNMFKQTEAACYRAHLKMSSCLSLGSRQNTEILFKCEALSVIPRFLAKRISCLVCSLFWSKSVGLRGLVT